MRTAPLSDDRIRLFKRHGTFITSFGRQCVKDIRHRHESDHAGLHIGNPVTSLEKNSIKIPIQNSFLFTFLTPVSSHPAHFPAGRWASHSLPCQ